MSRAGRGGATRMRVTASARSTASLWIGPTGRRVGDAAAEAAFYVASSVLPLMLTTSAALRALRPWLGGDAGPSAREGLAAMLRIVLTNRGDTAVAASEKLLAGEGGGLLTVGTLGSLFTLSRAFRSVLASLDTITGHPDPAPRRQQWLWSAGLAALGVMLAAITLALTALGPLLGHSRDVGVSFHRYVALAWIALRYPAAFAAVTGFLTLVLRIGLSHLGPGRARLRWRQVLPAAAVTSLSWLLITVMLPVYVHVVGAANPAIGALGGGLILLLWAYLLMVALFLGGAVTTRRNRAVMEAPEARRP